MNSKIDAPNTVGPVQLPVTDAPELVLRGIPVAFPFQPYQVQRVLMERVIEALQTKTNALIESPTGTGKSLSLLCSTRAWQKAQESKPLIIYASRTHAQLEQVAKELKKTKYAGNALIVGSRETSCSHPEVSRLKGRDQIMACRSLVDSKSCVQRERTLPEIRRNSQIVDIEEIVKPGAMHQFCPYYYARDMLSSFSSGAPNGKAVNIVFMPYNYLVDPISRRGLSIPWKDAVVVIDEAHNIEDVCEDACSFSLDRTQMFHAINEIDNLMRKCTSSGGRLAQYDITSADLAKIKAIFKGLNESFQQCYQGTLTSNGVKRKGSDLFDLCREQMLTIDTYRQLIGKLDACVEALNPHGRFLEGIVKCITRTFELGGEELNYEAAYAAAADFYRLIFEKNEGGRWKLNFWCFSPGVAMRELQRLGVGSIVVASGTLAPLDSFATSLRIPFPVRLESPHVVSKERVWLGVVPKGVTGRPLNCSFGQRDNVEYQQELGNTLAALARLIPDGILVFFPSYSVMNACVATWKQCDVWTRLSKIKDAIVVEDRGIAAGEEYDKALEGGGGAMLFAVCRGKASEGMDFKDKRARGVIVVGLPFPSKTDARVVQKRTYLDETRAQHPQQALLSGQTWYTQQGYRAVNQAVGRAIRHEHDFGAIILLDERFAGIRNQLSLWLRCFFRVFDNRFGDAIASLVTFFKHLKASEPAPRPLIKTTLATSAIKPQSAIPSAAAIHAVVPSSLTLPAPNASGRAFSSSNRTDGSRGSTVGASLAATRSSSSTQAGQNFSKPIIEQATTSTTTSTSRAVLENRVNLEPSSLGMRPSDKFREAQTTTSAASTEPENASKRPRVLDPPSKRRVEEYVQACRAVLSPDDYRSFKQLLHDYQTRNVTVPAKDLNQQAIRVFSSVTDKAAQKSLLLRLAGFLPPVQGRSLQVELASLK